MSELYSEFKKYENEALGCGAIPHTYESWLAWQLRTARAENRALQAKIDAALAIPQSEPSIAAFYQAYNAGADHMRREFRKVLEGK